MLSLLERRSKTLIVLNHLVKKFKIKEPFGLVIKASYSFTIPILSYNDTFSKVVFNPMTFSLSTDLTVCGIIFIPAVFPQILVSYFYSNISLFNNSLDFINTYYGNKFFVKFSVSGEILF